MGTQKDLVAACPKCGARYRVDAQRLSPQGGRLRCARCKAVFRVMPPPVNLAEPPNDFVGAPQSSGHRGPVVVIADHDVVAGKALAEVLSTWEFEPVLVHDGVEAILTIQRLLPAVAVLDTGLPKMFGDQVCELMKRNESLRRIHVVLVGALDHQERNRREPDGHYGADAYVERPQLPEALRPILRGFGIHVGGAAVDLPAAPRVPPVALPQPLPRPDVSAAPPVADEPGVAEAERLARIIVSDIVLYNPEKFEAGVRSGDVLDLLAGALDEGRALFAQRVDPGVRAGRDFLTDELLRVARSRGMAD